MKNRVFIVFIMLFIGTFLCQCSVSSYGNQENTAIELPTEGDGFLAAGKYDDAIESYSSFLKLDPVSAEAYYSRGKAYFLSGRYVQAVADFNSSIELNPQNQDAYYLRAWAHIANGAVSRAKEDFDEVIKENSALLTAYNGRQWCYASMAQWDQSSVLYLYQKFESDVGLAAAYKDKSWSFVKQMQWDLASVPDPVEALQMTVDMAGTYCNRGFAFFKKAQWQAAISDVQKTYEIDPGLNRGNWNIDWAIGKSNEWDTVIDENNKILAIMGGSQINPDSAQDNNYKWQSAAVNCYLNVIDLSPHSETAQKSEKAIDFIGEWEKEVGLSR